MDDVVITLPRPRRLLLRVPLDAAALVEARQQFREFLAEDDGLDEIIVGDIVLCLQEACENAVKFSGSDDGIMVELLQDRSSFNAVVRDSGVGLDPRRLERLTDVMAESGRGLYLMNLLMDDVEIHVQDGTEVRMHKVLKPRPPRRPRPTGRRRRKQALFGLQRRRRAA